MPEIRNSQETERTGENGMKMDRTLTEGMARAAEDAVRGNVWVSDIFWSTTVAWTNFSCDLYEADEAKARALIAATRDGEVVPENAFPDVMWSTSSKQDRKKAPHVFRANALDVVSGEMAELLRRHDIGETKLIPVTLLRKDRKTPYEGEFFFLNIREKKRAFDPDRSHNFKPQKHVELTHKGSMPLVLGHGDISVSEEAVLGPDLWLDPDLRRAYFFKGDLAREILKRKLMPSTRTESLSFAQCIVGRADAEREAE